jgi:hypothetical protein
MPDDLNRGDALYNHYSGKFSGMTEDDRVSLGSAFRILHEVARAMNQLDLSNDSIPILGWEETIKLDSLKIQGYDLKFEVWLALGPVGQLAKLMDEIKYLYNSDFCVSPHAALLKYPTLPDSESLFNQRAIPREWMEFLRHLRERYLLLDADLTTMATNPVDLFRFVLHGYFLVTLLHQALSILEVAELVLQPNELKGEDHKS